MSGSDRGPRVCALVAGFDGEGRILLGRKREGPMAGKWVIPGGKVEWGERLHDAARREFSEESGAVCPGGLLEVGMFEHVEPDSHMVLVLYAAHVRGVPRAGFELDAVEWLPLVHEGQRFARVYADWEGVPPAWVERVAAMHPLTRRMIALADFTYRKRRGDDRG